MHPERGLLLLLAACRPDAVAPPAPAVGVHEDDLTPAVTDGAVDVVVIGAGTAGLAAAWAASEAGARVLLLEREPAAGGSALYAGFFFAAGTTWQEAVEVEDSAELALEEWEDFTRGDASDETVQAFVRASAEVVDWVASVTGLDVTAVMEDADTGSARRVHVFDTEALGPALVSLADGLLLTEARADDLLVEDGHVSGVRWTDLATGDEREVRAGAVVVATGGFARNLDRLVAEVPDLARQDLVYEAAYCVDGGGHGLLDGVGAGRHNEGTYGLYVHATRDFRAEYEDEALLMPQFTESLIVDLAGRRVADEEDVKRLRMADALFAAPDQRLFALFDEDTFSTSAVVVPGYNWADPTRPEFMNPWELFEGDAAWYGLDAASIADSVGIDADGLAATIATYDAIDEVGEDAEFGKDPALVHPFGDQPIVAVELFAGAAKAFSGFRTDLQGRVLDASGTPVAGLYGAGEVVGMLGTAAVGTGFSGAVTACTWLGLEAGASAAAEALARR